MEMSVDKASEMMSSGRWTDHPDNAALLGLEAIKPQIQGGTLNAHD